MKIFHLLLLAPALAAAPNISIDAAFERIYSFDFVSGRAIARAYIAAHQRDPLGPAVAAAADLFAELERLQLLTAEPGGGRVQVQPDPEVWARIQAACQLAAQQAQALDPDDANALTALMLAKGIERDYLALVQKNYRQSWVSARLAQQSALRLRRRHPDLGDAWFTIGFSDYLVASVPFFLKPFMKMEGAEGNRPQSIANLEKAARGGRYLKGFAQLLLAQIYRKDHRDTESTDMLRLLVAEHPDNRVVTGLLSKSGQ